MQLKFSGLGKVLLLGGGELLSICAIDLKAAGTQVVVITSPRQAAEIVSSGKTLTEHLSTYAVAIHITEDVNSDSTVLGLICDESVGLSIAAAWIFRQPLISRFDGRLLNAHSMRLPRDRGSGGFSWLIMNGDREGMCLVHQIDKGLDTGPIVRHRAFLYPPTCRVPQDYREVFVAENRVFLAQLFNDIRNKHDFPLLHQVEYLSTYWPRLSTEHSGFIDWSWGLRDIERFICAFDSPYAGASTFINGQRVYVKQCLISFVDGVFHPFQKGLVFRQDGNRQFVATDQGTLILDSVTDSSGANFAKQISLGDRFYTPIQQLELARQGRAVVTPFGLRYGTHNH